MHHTNLSRGQLIAVLELTQVLSSSVEIHDILFTVVERIAAVVDVDRASIVLCGDEDDAFVIAASDDKQLRDLPIKLSAYPEIGKVLSTGQAMTIADIGDNQLFALAGVAVPLRFRALTLFPISFGGETIGVLFLRFEKPRELTDADRFVIEAVANATGIALRNATLVQSLRDQSRSADAETKKRLRSLKRYVDFFELSADGILVVTREAEVLFCNPAASKITGHSAEELRGGQFDDMLSEDGRESFGRIQSGFEKGVFPANVDLPIRTASNKRRVLNVSFSVLPQQGNVIVSLRDVTDSRALERELTKTKEFLQRVIDSSVDAIVSADMRGNVLLFNPAAERTYGWTAEEVIGKMNVRELYPDGTAQQIMALIRSDTAGGEGVLHSHETQLRGKDGTPIPVSLSASLIVHRGRDIGSVGVFTDLRAQRHIEERLKNAQQELAVQEKKAFVAELAGATAHELNQPLTTVMGYTGMLVKQLGDVEDRPRVKRALDSIVRETERMAEIVRKIGKLTKYESISYVGDTKIIDIEGSIDSEPPVTGL